MSNRMAEEIVFGSAEDIKSAEKYIHIAKKYYDYIVINQEVSKEDIETKVNKKIEEAKGLFIKGCIKNYNNMQAVLITTVNVMSNKTLDSGETYLVASRVHNFVDYMLNGHIFARRDKNNVFFCNILHRDFINEYLQVVDDSIYIANLHKYYLERIKDIDATKIAEVKIRFDKEAYISMVNNYLEVYKKEVQQNIKNVTEIKLKLKEKEIERLKSDIEAIRQKAFTDAVRVIDGIYSRGWKLKTIDGTLYFVLDKKIVCSKVINKGVAYKLTTDIFYAENIRVEVTDTVYTKHVHVSNCYHPNISSADTVCLGDLDGKDLLTVLKNIEDLVKTINLDSCYDNEATFEIEDHLSDYTDEELSVWTS